MACVDGMSHFTSGAEGIEAAVGARTSGTWSASAVGLFLCVHIECGLSVSILCAKVIKNLELRITKFKVYIPHLMLMRVNFCCNTK